MTVRRMLLPLSLLLLLVGGGIGLQADPVWNLPAIREAGSYTRRVWTLPVYQVTLETLDPQAIGLSWRQRVLRSGRLPETPDWTRLASFLTDPGSRVPLRVTVRVLTGLKSYPVESRTIRDFLRRVGLPLDDHWALQPARGAERAAPGTPALQREVQRLAEVLLGLSSDRLGPWYRARKKGDSFVFQLDGDGHASVSYLPGPGNPSARPGRAEFADPRAVAALVRACLLPGPEEEGADPAALLKGIREACLSRSAVLY